ncbi:MAG: ABC transporter permease [Nitratireductor sp.]
MLLLMVVVGVSPLLLPYDAETMSGDAILAPPSASHWAGTDHLGRDLLARALLGGRTTLGLALLGTVLGVGAGAVVGMVAGYKGGRLDLFLMRLCDAFMALPSIILAMLVLIAVGNGPVAILLAIIGIFVPRSARIVRSATLNVVPREFVAAASVIGETQISILFREILPNIWPNILVEACLRFSYSILIISALGYLGIGIQPPTPDWGVMIADGTTYITIAPWMILAPAAGIVVSVISINLLGDLLQDVIGDRQKRTASHV